MQSRETKPSNGLVENALMLLRGVIRTTKCHVESCTQEEPREDSPILPWLVEHAGSILSRCQKGRDGRTPLEPFGEKVLARPISSEPLNRMNPRYKFGVWLGVRDNGAECFVATAEGVFRAREVRRADHQDWWEKEAINNVIGVPWRIADGKRTVDSPATQIDPLPPPPVPFEGARVQRERITRTDIETLGTTAGCPGCNAIRSGKRAQAHSDPCRARIEECLRTTPHVAERPDRRSEMLNEALAKEVERNVKRREEIGNTAGELAVPQELKDMPIPPDSDLRRRRAMRAETEAASSSSSQMEGSRAVAETPTQQNSRAAGSRMDVEGKERDESRSSKAQNITRRIMTKTSMERSRMDDEGEEEDELRSSTIPNTRRRMKGTKK